MGEAIVAVASERPALVVVAPLAPAPTGNGLAMRVHALVDAALEDHDVHLVVSPSHRPGGVIEDALAARLASHQVLEPARWSRRPVVRARATATWRLGAGGRSSLPGAAALAPPQLAGEVVLDGPPPRAVLACRLALGPLGVALAERLGAPLVLDADDDDEALLRSLGDPEAAAYGRLAAACLPMAQLVFAAGSPDADSLTRRHHLDPPVAVVPNVTPLPHDELQPPPGEGRVLLVGSLTYAPNVDGARWLVDEVLPLLPDHLQLHLVGAHDARVAELAGTRVVVHGWVPQVDEHYRAADVAVVPLRHGAGTRTKALEAFAHRRAVVSTTAGVSGLEVVADRHVRIGDDPEAFAAQVAAAADAARSAHPDPLVHEAEVLATTTYHPDTVRGQTAARLRAVDELSA